MKKIISLVLVLTLCLSTLTYADPIWGDNMNPQGEAQVNIIGKTNEGWVVAEEDGVVIVPFDNANPNAQNGRSMPSVVGGPGNDPLLDLLFGIGGNIPVVNPTMGRWCHCTCKIHGPKNQIGCGHEWDAYIREGRGVYDNFPSICPKCRNTNIECVFD